MTGILTWFVVVLALSAPASAGEPPTPELKKLHELLVAGRYADAEVAARAVLEEVEVESGADSLETASVLDMLARSMWAAGKAPDPETLAIAERVVKIREKRLGPDHVDVAMGLESLGNIFSMRGDYEKARPFFERSLTIREAALGPEHPVVGRSYLVLALLLTDTGDYDGARDLYERCLSIEEKTHGAEHPNVALVLNNLANVYYETGEYGTVRRLHERALAIREKTLGPDHIDVAQSLNNLANVLRMLGDYAGSVRLHERALAIETTQFGPDHPYAADSLDNLANVQSDMGDFVVARENYERALTIREKSLGAEHPLVANSLDNLAVLLIDTGEPGAARPHLERAIAIRKKALGEDHPHVAKSIDSLGGVLMDMGEYERARNLFQQALAIREKSFEPDHPELAVSMLNLGALANNIGDLDEARSLIERAIGIRENALGPDHPLMIESLVGLAGVLAAAGDPAAAFDVALRAERIGREHLQLTARSLAEREALRYASVRTEPLDLVLSLAAGGLGGETKRDAWDALIRSRAQVLDEMSTRRRTVAVAGDAVSIHLADEVVLAAQRLAKMTVAAAGEGSGETYRSRLEELRGRKERAERELARHSAVFRDALTNGRTGLREVEAALTHGDAVAAFVRFERRDLGSADRSESGAGMKGPGAAPGHADSTSSYLVFILLYGKSAPKVIPLGTAQEIEALVAAWAEEAGHGALSGRRTPEEAEVAYRRIGDRLRRVIWDPVSGQLEKAQRVFIVPDAALSLVNFAALPADGEGYLVESGPVFHHLSAERDLASPGASSHDGRGLFALGSPAFDDSTVVASSASGASVKTAEGVAIDAPVMESLNEGLDAGKPFRGERSACDEFRSVRFEPLPASAREVAEISSLWLSATGDTSDSAKSTAGGPAQEVVTLTGAAASEAAFKTGAPGRRVLHLATHGFFLGGDCARGAGSRRGIGGLKPSVDASGSRETGNVLLLSGLALAGANHRAAAGPDVEDGILTAAEIAALDLSGVEWAVLSACDTGVGEIQSGEGVFGLRRAFQVAGARTLIMSLWSVEDEAAQLWMSALYEARFTRGLPTIDAVHEASLAILSNRRSEDLSTHPFYWAGFVATGDWR